MEGRILILNLFEPLCYLGTMKSLNFTGHWMAEVDEMTMQYLFEAMNPNDRIIAFSEKPDNFKRGPVPAFVGVGIQPERRLEKGRDIQTEGEGSSPASSMEVSVGRYLFLQFEDLSTENLIRRYELMLASSEEEGRSVSPSSWFLRILEEEGERRYQLLIPLVG
ncbi:MAG TPA: hypothetical protein PLG43_02335 [Spirochaetia bacterium]|nr:hypothetical protein [Spirochaetia bacterium]